MKLERQILWIIPGNNAEDYQLEDGVGVFYEAGIRGGDNHQVNCNDFSKRIGVYSTFCNSHIDYGKLFASLGMIVVFNCNAKIDGKYYLAMILPDSMSAKQIEFLESQKEFFQEKYNSDVSFFDVKVYTSNLLYYKTSDGLRDLRIESIIERNPSNNGQELLYREVERQKKELNKIKKYDNL